MRQKDLEVLLNIVNVNPQSKAKILSSFCVVLFSQLAEKSKPRLNGEEQSQIVLLLNQGSFDQALKFIEAKYDKNEWEKFYNGVLEFLVVDFINDVQKL